LCEGDVDDQADRDDKSGDKSFQSVLLKLEGQIGRVQIGKHRRARFCGVSHSPHFDFGTRNTRRAKALPKIMPTVEVTKSCQRKYFKYNVWTSTSIAEILTILDLEHTNA
jgi:hypothetical protein